MRCTIGALRMVLLPVLAVCVASACDTRRQPPFDSDARLRHDLSRAASLRVYFGHQSVGANIVAGMLDLLAASGERAWTVAELRSDSGWRGEPAFLHSYVGINGRPEAKQDAFERMVGSLSSRGLDVAMLKFCYVDVTASSDAAPLFERYRTRIRELKRQFPAVTFLHVTVPLTTRQPGWKGFVKYLLGRAPEPDADNAKRSEYNRLLRQEYSGEPIFDLARLESAEPDGKPIRAEASNAIVERLRTDYTSDGGHLNALGRRLAARELLRVLATVNVAGHSSSPSGR